MTQLWLYELLSRLRFLTYRSKFLVVAFIGIHLPLIALVSYLVLRSAPTWESVMLPVGVTLAATLLGTGVTLFVLHQLLRPVLLTTQALRDYRDNRRMTDLPTRHEDEVGVLMADASATIDYLERARDTLENADEVTGLPNRRKLIELMVRQSTHRRSFTIAVVRLVNFARITEALDLGQANEAARHIASRLERQVQADCVIAHIERADFALFYTHAAASNHLWSETTAQLRALIAGCRQALSLGGLDVRPELRCGVAHFPEDGSDVETLLDHAIAAVAQATSTAPVILYSPEARRAARERLSMEQELRRALDEAEFCLYYQPVVDLKAGRIVAAEALIRWQHPERGILLPGAFIDAAESSGLIDSIDIWVLYQACEQLRIWNRTGPPNLQVSINLSAHQFRNYRISTRIEQAIVAAGIDPGQIELELTETSAMVDLAYTRRMFTILRKLGLSIAIDDFGTGYGSLSYLRELPFDKLKIDRQFVDRVHEKRDGQAICDSLIALSQGLELTIVSEGTEREEEIHYLHRRGCQLFQGYYFARPMPARDFAELFDSGLSSLDAFSRSADIINPGFGNG